MFRIRLFFKTSVIGKVSKGSVRLISSEKNVVKSKVPDIILPRELIHEYVWKNLEKWPTKTALVCIESNRRYTYEQMYKLTNNFASNLIEKLKLNVGDTLAIVLPNVPEYAIVFLGASQAGLRITTVNPVYTPDEIAKQFVSSKPKMVVAYHDIYPTIRQTLKLVKKEIPVIIVKKNQSQDSYSGCIKFEEICTNANNNLNNKVSVEDVAVLPYSSGTTGLPKGVELTHNSIVTNLYQMSDPSFKMNLETSGSFQDTVPLFLPFFHIYGLFVIFLNMFSQGCKLVVIPKFGTNIFLKLLKEFRPTLMFGVPPVVLMLLNNPEFGLPDINYMRTFISAAAPLGAADIERFYKKTNGAINLLQMYGMTETSPLTLMQSTVLENGVKVGGSGLVIPNTECKIVGLQDETGTGLGPYQSGEIWIRGPQNMKGYYNNIAATREVLVGNNWLRTGDIGYYDEDHHFFITDRFKELIKVKGYQVAPAEIEEVIRNHKMVVEAAVIGVPHNIYGEVPKAFVVLKNGSATTKEEIQKYVASKVTAYKHLTGGVTFLDSIPKTPSGKILRRELKKISETL